MKKLVIAGLGLLLCSSQAAQAYVLGGINTDVVYTVKSDNNDGNTTGYRTGLTLAYGMDRYYISGRLALGADSYGNVDAGQDETDIELSTGYRILPNLSAFIAYRIRTQDYSRTSGNELEATEKHNHYGVGAALSYPLDSQWLIKSDIKAFYMISQYETDLLFNTANGFSGGASAGIIHVWKNGFNASLTGNLQAMSSSYNTGGSYLDVTTGISLAIAKIF